jgi:hypothetical protein
VTPHSYRVPDELELEQEPSREWIEALWPYLNRHFPSSLDQFVDLPIAPVGSNLLGFLKIGSSFVFMNRNGSFLPPNISTTIEANFGAIVLKDPPNFFSHPQLFRYIRSHNYSQKNVS